MGCEGCKGCEGEEVCKGVNMNENTLGQRSGWFVPVL